jgi:hypothetical protein
MCSSSRGCAQWTLHCLNELEEHIERYVYEVVLILFCKRTMAKHESNQNAFLLSFHPTKDLFCVYVSMFRDQS